MSFSGLWKRTKRRLGAVNSHYPWSHKSHWCAWGHYTLPAVRGDADAECPPGLDTVFCLCVSGAFYSAPFARLGQYGPGRPCGPLKDNCPVTDAVPGGRQAAASGGRACPSLHHGQRVKVQETTWAEKAEWCGGDCAAAPPGNEGAKSIFRIHSMP